MATFRDTIIGAVGRALTAVMRDLGADTGERAPAFAVEYPELAAHGDYATNAALISTKLLKKPPMDIAEALAAVLRRDPAVTGICSGVTVAKPGFVNFTLSPDAVRGVVGEVLRAKSAWGRSAVLKGQYINIEFISANPTGPLTLANGRGGFWGDVLGNIFAFAGAKVEKEYYVNDAGNQVRTLGESVLAAGGLIPAADHHYQGPYIADYAKEIGTDLAQYAADPEALGARVAASLFDREIKPPILRAGIRFDRFTSEAKDVRTRGVVEKRLGDLAKLGATYEKDGALWLRTTAHGDSEDRVLTRSGEGGEPTYLAVDIAYHMAKWARGATRLIDIWGADHHGAVVRLNAALALLGKSAADIILMQLVRLVKDGEEVKMSKRAGNFVTLAELFDEVGVDVARFFFLMYQPNSHMEFDLSLAKEKSQKNPVFYVQYAHARIASVLTKAKAVGDRKAKRDLSYLASPEELSLIKTLSRFPELCEDLARSGEVHRLPQYAVELAGAFHKFYETSRIVDVDRNISMARIMLTEATRVVLTNALGLMGITAPEVM